MVLLVSQPRRTGLETIENTGIVLGQDPYQHIGRVHRCTDDVPGEHSVTGIDVNENAAMWVLAFKHKKAAHVAVLMMSRPDNDWIV